MRVAVTGASGFVGGAVATALADRGDEVLAFGRTPGGWSHPSPRAAYAVWTLPSSPPRPLEVDAVVHAAALADDWAPLEQAMAANRDGTVAVLAAVGSASPAARVVHISSSSVTESRGPSVREREDAPIPSRHSSPYAASKAAAEGVLVGTGALILRPHAVYGPGDRTLLPRVEAAVRGGVLRLPDGGRARHTLTSIDALVAAVVAGLEQPAVAGVISVGDDGDVVLGDVIAEFLARRGRAARIRAVPMPLALAAAGAAEATARLRGRRPAITRYAVRQLGLEHTYDLARGRELLGLRPAATSLAGAEHW